MNQSKFFVANQKEEFISKQRNYTVEGLVCALGKEYNWKREIIF